MLEQRRGEFDPGPALRRHLEALVGERSPVRSPGALARAEDHAASVFAAAGWRVGREPIRAAGGRFANVVADRPAPSQAPLFLVGAHLDTVEGTPGADDNASGAAILLALAEHLGALPDPPGVSLRLVAFNLEEWGMAGSSEHAAALAAAGREVAGMIALEMVGYVDPAPGSQRYPPGVGFGRRRSGDFISVVGNLRSRRLVRGVAEALEGVPDLPVEALSLPTAAALMIGAGLSDHAPFWRQRAQAVMVGDTSFYRNPHYHRPGDALETLSLPFMEKVCRGLAAFLQRGAGAA